MMCLVALQFRFCHREFCSRQWMQYNVTQYTLKLTNSQLNLPHGTKNKQVMKKLKTKTEMPRRNGPVIQSSVKRFLFL